MDKIKIRIAGHTFEGEIKERSQRREESDHMHIAFVDLDAECRLSDSLPPPPAEVQLWGDWRPATIERIPTGPTFRRIVLSFAD